MLKHTLWFILALCLTSKIWPADLDKVMRDTQRFSSKPDSVAIVWWIPTDFWKVAFQGNPKITAEQTDEFIRMLDGYTILCIASGKLGPTGGYDPTPADTIRGSLKLKIQEKAVEMIAGDDLPPDVKNLVDMLKPVLTNMLGQFGKSMEFYVYPNTGKDVRRLDPKQPGEFIVLLGKQTFKWRLPLGSLLPDKVDTKTGEHFPGDYLFNPYTGAELK